MAVSGPDDALTSAAAPAPAPDPVGVRFARLEGDLRRMRAWLWALALAGLMALTGLFLFVANRHLDARADTIIAHRFVLEHEGKVRAELSMHRAGFAQLLLGPDDRFQRGVAIGDRGEIVVRGDSAMGVHMFGRDVSFSGPGGDVRGFLELGPDGKLWWYVPDDAGKMIKTLLTPRRSPPGSSDTGTPAGSR